MRSPNLHSHEGHSIPFSGDTSHTHHRFLDKIYKWKLWFILVVFALATICLYVFAYWVAGPAPAQWRWLSAWPLDSLASSCLSAVLIGFAYEWLVRKETGEKLDQTLEQALTKHEQIVSKAIFESILTNSEIMHDVFPAETVDNIARAALKARLGNDQLANEAYDSFLSQILTSQERRQNYSCAVSLTSVKDNLPDEVKALHYDGYVHVSYETILRKKEFLFVCVSTIEEYTELLRDQTWELRWIIEKTRHFPSLDESVFTVTEFIVNGLKLNLKREDHNSRYVLSATHPDLEKLLGQKVRIEYRYRTKFQKRGHSLLVNVPCPTKNVKVELDYSATDIHYVNVRDLLVSKAKPRIQYYPSDTTPTSPRRIDIEVDEWVFPKGGVVFVWVLNEEMASGFVKMLSSGKPPSRGGNTRALS